MGMAAGLSLAVVMLGWLSVEGADVVPSLALEELVDIVGGSGASSSSSSSSPLTARCWATTRAWRKACEHGAGEGEICSYSIDVDTRQLIPSPIMSTNSSENSLVSSRHGMVKGDHGCADLINRSSHVDILASSDSSFIHLSADASSRSSYPRRSTAMTRVGGAGSTMYSTTTSFGRCTTSMTR
eukprot:767156-Hanusia_phi.AAC.3